MERIWRPRLRRIGAGLLAAALAALGLAAVLRSAGDLTGAQALCGAAVVMGLGLVIDVCVLAIWSGRTPG
jgi:hypothetical protein